MYKLFVRSDGRLCDHHCSWSPVQLCLDLVDSHDLYKAAPMAIYAPLQQQAGAIAAGHWLLYQVCVKLFAVR